MSQLKSLCLLFLRCKLGAKRRENGPGEATIKTMIDHRETGAADMPGLEELFDNINIWYRLNYTVYIV